MENNVKKTKVIVYDLDETLCTKKKSDETYYDVKPINELIDQLNKLKEQGYEIHIDTARNMATQKNDVSKVIQNVGIDTLNWLRDNNINYDSIDFGKRYALIYIDDKSCLNHLPEIERRMKHIENGTEKEYIRKQLKLLDNQEEILKFINDIAEDNFDPYDFIEDARKLKEKLDM